MLVPLLEGTTTSGHSGPTVSNASGSGISAIRPVIAAVRRERGAYGQVTLYFGARTPDGFAYQGELKQWQEDGVKVLCTVSRPGTSGWQGLTGYVQAHLGEERLEHAIASADIGRMPPADHVLKKRAILHIACQGTDHIVGIVTFDRVRHPACRRLISDDPAERSRHTD